MFSRVISIIRSSGSHSSSTQVLGQPFVQHTDGSLIAVKNTVSECIYDILFHMRSPPCVFQSMVYFIAMKKSKQKTEPEEDRIRIREVSAYVW